MYQEIEKDSIDNSQWKQQDIERELQEIENETQVLIGGVAETFFLKKINQGFARYRCRALRKKKGRLNSLNVKVRLADTMK